MKKILLIALLLLLPFSAKARCTDAEKIKLNKLASNVSFTYNYTEKNGKITFDVTVTNLTKDLILYDRDKDTQHNVNGEITIKGYEPASSASFYVFAKDDTCIYSAIATNTINFPSYNPYYNDPLCKEAPNYEYCKKWVNNTSDYNTFKSNITKYIKDKKAEEVVDNKEEENVSGIFDYVFEFYVRFYFIILPLIIITCLSLIYYLNKKNSLI